MHGEMSEMRGQYYVTLIGRVSLFKTVMNSVDSLLKTSFTSRSLEEKLEIKQLGRPTPDLHLIQEAKGRGQLTYNRKFNRKAYDHSWVCGCDVRNALFCFPCLLFGNNDAWSSVGVKDLGHLNMLMKKHSETVRHINNVLDLNALGSVNIATLLSGAYHEKKVKHKQQVEKNRYVLSRIIDSMKSCSAFELALRGQDESETSENPGVFFGLVDFVSCLDSAVKEHIESNKMLKGTSKMIQNELLDCMLKVCRSVIMEEMKQADFVAVMVEETTDASENTQLILVFRYEKDCVPCERFWGFLNPEGQSADAISKCILNVIDEIFKDNPHKIIALTYDGASVMGGGIGGVQAKLAVNYPNVHYIHCYTQQLNLTIERAASQNQSARIFFLNLSAFPTFFSRSPQRMSALEAVTAQRNLNGPQTSWNFKSKTVNLVYEYKDSLVECLSNLEKASSNQTCLEANGLCRSLKDEQFLLWLSFFHKLMPHVDVLYNHLQARSADAVKLKSSVSHFLHIVNKTRVSVDNIDSEVTSTYATSQSKRRKLACWRTDAKEVCDRVMIEVRDHFQALQHLEAAKLLNSVNFEEYSRRFPEKELQITTQSYTMLEKKGLKTELSVLYQRQDFRHSDGAVPLLNFILTNNLQETFSETTKLLKILVTTPMTTSEPERCFSSLKRIKTFLRNTVSQEQLSALAMLSIEKGMVSNMEGFNTMVIEKFLSKKQCSMDFTFHQKVAVGAVVNASPPLVIETALVKEEAPDTDGEMVIKDEPLDVDYNNFKEELSRISP